MTALFASRQASVSSMSEESETLVQKLSTVHMLRKGSEMSSGPAKNGCEYHRTEGTQIRVRFRLTWLKPEWVSHTHTFRVQQSCSGKTLLYVSFGDR
eukprot:4703288-Amphidinium_carterae.1